MENNSKTLADQIRELPDDKVVITTIEGIAVGSISELLNQSVEGLLYDLNRDMTTNYARLDNGDMRAINDIAIAKILTRILTLNKSIEDMSEQRYRIELNKRQLQMLSMMCDRMSRLICGQLGNSVQEFVEQAWERRHKTEDNPHGMGEGWHEMRQEVEHLLDKLKDIGWGLDRYASNGIHYDDVADLLWEMHQVMRHQLWLDNPNRLEWSVDGRESMGLTDEPMIKVEKV